ncbi:MAG: hypothetical protein ACK4K0_11585 [Flavobacteriales bacterium]
MRKQIYFTLGILLNYSFSFASSCDSTTWAKSGTYEVRIIENSVESTDVKPRKLSTEELCMIEENRDVNDVVILRLDSFTEVKIFPLIKNQPK